MRCSIALALAVLCAGFASAAQEPASPAQRLNKLADEFYVARASFDPLHYATANGDSRYDDQVGMSISPQVRAAYFAHM